MSQYCGGKGSKRQSKYGEDGNDAFHSAKTPSF
jgi:hypothetical protein